MANGGGGAPDLQAAGVTGPESEPQSILRALSMGQAPNALAPQAMPAMGASPQQGPMNTWANTLAGFGAGFQNKENPVIAQQMQQQDVDRRSQMAMFSVRQSLEASRQKKEELTLNLAKSFIDTDEPGARLAGWTIKADIAKRYGFNLPPEVLQSLAAGGLTKEQMSTGAFMFLGGGTDEDILRGAKLQPRDLPFVKALAQSPVGQKQLLGYTPEEMQMKKNESAGRLLHYRLEQLRADLAERKETRQEAEGTARLAGAEVGRAQTDRRLAEMERHNKATEKRLEEALTLKLSTGDEKKQTAVRTMQTALDITRDLAARLDTKGYLPKTEAGPMAGLFEGDPSAAKARTNQSLFPNDADWQAWKQQQSFLIGFDRTVLNEIGARAFQAFKNQFALYDNPPTKAAIDQVLNNMQTLLDEYKSKGVPDGEKVTLLGLDGNIYVKIIRRGEPLPPHKQILKVE